MDNDLQRQLQQLINDGQLEQAKVLCVSYCQDHPEDLDGRFALGVINGQVGKLNDAEKTFQLIIHEQPENIQARYNLAKILFMQEKIDEAINQYRKVIQREPGFAVAAINLANALYQQESPLEAVQVLKDFLCHQPGHAKATSRIAVLLTKMDCLDEACDYFKQAIKSAPGYAINYLLLGDTLGRLGELEPAVDIYRQATVLFPEYIDAYMSLGKVLFASGQLAEAKECFQRAVTLDPGQAGAHYNLGLVLRDLGQLPAAVDAFQQAVKLRPDYAEAYNDLGLSILGEAPYTSEQLLRTMKYFHRAIAYNPGMASAHYNLGRVLRDLGQVSVAIDEFQQAIKLRPDYAVVFNSLGNALRDTGQYNAALECFQKALVLQPGARNVQSNILFLLGYHVLRSPAEMIEAHRQWGRLYGGAEKASTFVHVREGNPSKRLRIGYVSPDFHHHAVSRFFEPILKHHDPAQVEVFCYAEVIHPDHVTERLQGMAFSWCSSVGVDDEQMARRIYDDRIDILIDLAGHTARNRLGVFSYKPAPIQVTYLGYCTTTGLSTMDYWLTDEVLHPKDTVELAVEEIYRLPRCWASYQPDKNSPPVEREQDQSQVTFGSFNNLSKLTLEVIECWSQILQAVAGSRLLLKTRQLADATVQEKLKQQFSAYSIPAERLILLPASADYLQAYHQIDIALDTFPRTGGATTADALWMGVPVITLCGERFIERQGASMLTALGLEALVASSKEDYVNKAVALAGDAEQRGSLRAGLRQRMADSDLYDGKGMALALENAYRDMWRRYLAASDE